MAALMAAAAAIAARILSNQRWEPCAGEAMQSLCGAGPSEGCCISQPTETSKGGKGKERLQKSMKLSVGRQVMGKERI